MIQAVLDIPCDVSTVRRGDFVPGDQSRAPSHCTGERLLLFFPDPEGVLSFPALRRRRFGGGATSQEHFWSTAVRLLSGTGP